MQKEVSPWILSRRSVLALAGTGLVAWDSLFASSSEFWNKKDPSQWSGEEIDQLTSKSPWAKSVTAQAAPSSYGNSGQGNPNGGGYPGGGGYPRNGGGMGGPSIGIGGIGIGMPRGRGGMGGGRGGGMGRGAGVTYKGTVRWESAQPILDALKNPLPDAFAKHYVIGVRDIPLIEDRPPQRRNDDDSDSSGSSSTSTSRSTASNPSKDTLEYLKQSTTLQPKGRNLAQAGVVQQMTPGGTYFLFGFSKELLDFGKNDREVEFSTRLGRVLVKAKFDMKEMTYHGKLAV
jgi:hypothetical protein